MIKFEFYEQNDLNREFIDKLWDQGVCMDDWDYMLFFENNQIKIENTSIFRINLEPESYLIAGLLQGCCKNIWYNVKDFMGREGILGVAYHS